MQASRDQCCLNWPAMRGKMIMRHEGYGSPDRFTVHSGEITLKGGQESGPWYILITNIWEVLVGGVAVAQAGSVHHTHPVIFFHRHTQISHSHNLAYVLKSSCLN